MDRRTPIAVAVVALVVLAGCSAAGGGSGGGGDAAASELDSKSAAVEEAESREPMAEDGGGGGGGDGGDGGSSDDAAVAAEGADATVTGRSIIRTGRVRLRVENFQAARSNLTAIVEARGGYVSDSTRRVNDHGDGEWTTGQVVLRVPAENFSATMTAVERQGEVLESRTESKDVTDRVIDLRARLKNLRAERERLRSLYRNASDTEDVLAVERRLSEVQTEIERVEAQLASLERRVAYSTITVEMAEPRPEGPAPEQWYDTPVLAAFLASVEGVGVVLRALVVGAAYAAPYLLVFLGPVAVGGVLLYRNRDRLR